MKNKIEHNYKPGDVYKVGRVRYVIVAINQKGNMLVWTLRRKWGKRKSQTFKEWSDNPLEHLGYEK